jgi:hypothetical protein
MQPPFGALAQELVGGTDNDRERRGLHRRAGHYTHNS